jgi:hypothetical protein
MTATETRGSDSVAVGKGSIFPALIGISDGAAPGVEETNGSSHVWSPPTVEQTGRQQTCAGIARYLSVWPGKSAPGKTLNVAAAD